MMTCAGNELLAAYQTDHSRYLMDANRLAEERKQWRKDHPFVSCLTLFPKALPLRSCGVGFRCSISKC